MEIVSVEPNVDKLVLDGRTIYLVGTAHVSESSSALVERVISQIQPATVAIELCEGRYRSLQDPDRWKNTNIVTVIREGRANILLAQLMLAAFQKKIAGKLSIRPGAEMLRAASAAERIGAKLTMCDRDISVTLKRTWAGVGFIGMMKLIYAMVSGLFIKQEIASDEIERLKSSDALEELMREFTEALPDVRTSLIDERDQYLAMKIKSSPGESIVAVVGAAHIPGIKKWIEKDVDLAPISIIPKKSIATQIFGWSIPAFFAASLVYSFLVLGSDTSAAMFRAWFWMTGLFGALGAALAQAHPLTVVSAFLAAPFASLNPFIAAGWVAGLVEAIIRKPRVGDLENIANDMSSVRGVFANRVSKTLLIVAFTNIFVMVGMVVGVKQVVSIASTGSLNADLHVSEPKTPKNH